ncbi:DUF2927 domain-containing protein [Haematobacter genomosp. 1]|uniref:ATP-dependent transcriptional regulator n=1 Tax=Haematobacter genomosp. 1 TaxID=366618 RepID=A0A212ADA1_9RHOB|nr:DUF2927 domain-containing protein [Haematobacter genomosp. 1]OWJ78973.1 ATP-dependent transcriptional regulator [Haematobacter genomosp. 1]
MFKHFPFRPGSIALAMGLALSACGQVRDQPTRLAAPVTALPAMKAFGVERIDPPRRANADMVDDFLELSFEMESGRALPVLTRFEGPVTLALTGPIPPSASGEVDKLLTRFRREAHIDITRVSDPAAARIVVEFVPQNRLRNAAPDAACFVAPNVTGWSDYLSARRTDRADWTKLTTRTRAGVFIPADASPQEIRDCLHEETAQAMGPLNDLYRLPDSVFNDDNFHGALTGFDMLMLRTYYAPELSSGMTRAEVAERLPKIIDRLNPPGRNVVRKPAGPTTADWRDAINTALSSGSAETRANAARRAVTIAQRNGWVDARLAFSHFTYARTAMAVDPEAAVTSLMSARRLYEGLPSCATHKAHVDMQLAAFALTSGDAQETLRLVEPELQEAKRWQNAALLSTLLMMKAEALDRLGRAEEAGAVRLDSLAWARYGFGADEAVRARLSEISALGPVNGRKKG